MGRRGSGLLLLAALAAQAIGCSGAHRRPLEFGHGAPGAPRVVVAPLNLAVALAPDLEDAVEPVNAELIHYLQDHGAHVAVIWDPDAWALWRDAAAAVEVARRRTPELAE